MTTRDFAFICLSNPQILQISQIQQLKKSAGYMFSIAA